MKPRGKGRPISGSEPRNEELHLRVTKTELESIKNQAIRNGISVTQLVITAVLKTNGQV